MEAYSILRIVILFVSFIFFLGVLPLIADMNAGRGSAGLEEEGNNTLSTAHRKLLNHRGGAMAEPNRIWGEKCSNADIVINQGPTSPLPSGIPSYTVEIVNLCVSGCEIGGIHLTCGWFSSARLINPKLFKRLRYNDCLVNDGKPLRNGGTISFEYANTFSYPLQVSSVVCK